MARGRIMADGPTNEVRAAYGGHTVTFRPPTHASGPDGIDQAWLDDVRTALAPLGIHDLAVAGASLEAAFLALTGTPMSNETEGAPR
jgi:ABC-2 type transport system ATP-binding protein